MSGLAIGDVLPMAKPGKPLKEFRSFQPVWRNSYYEGQLEPRLWRPVGFGQSRGSVRTGRRTARAVIDIARSLDRRTRVERKREKPGARNGALGEVGLAVLEALWGLVDYATGRLEPAIATLAERTGYCYSAVHDALVRLRAKGFLHWIRRSRPTENKGEAGPQVEQISNAYVLLLPPEVEALVRRMVDDGPPAACDADRRRSERKSLQEMIASLDCSTFHQDHWAGDQTAGETMARIAAILDAREQQERKSPRYRDTGGSS